LALIKELEKTNKLIRRQHQAHDQAAPILRVRELSVSFEERPALQQVSFEVPAGERLAVIGPNGAGKSTLFKVIAGVLAPSSGSVQISGGSPDAHICIAYVPQRSQVDWSFPVSVADVVMMGRVGKLGLFRWPTPGDWRLVRQALEVVGLQALAGRQISQLSGGQQQRMFIARALAQEAELMLMDEPLTGLDVPSQQELFRILDQLQARGVTVIIALHDLELASQHFDRVLLLNHRLIGIGAAEQVFQPELLMRAYGGHLRLIATQQGTVALEDTCCDDEPHSHD
jgi:ABC-type Mn2+/Zn2+ transport system ATPase subunit